MTYQNLGYWVAQANDLSTGSHPIGWTSGQRWSATSGEWQSMYNTEYSNARDNSTGQHPTGWASGQLWSTTAGQWVPMYNTEFANARDNSAGQTNSGLGASHPTGYATGQFWSTTAQQWNAMWGTEWRNSHDPQGYSFSYPGQGANAVYWSQSAQYWRGQADYYWGPSRVWNNGSTWEQNYNAYVGYYNDMLSQMQTWQARANSAWGPSRVWPNGESWEAAYNRVQVPDPPVAIQYSQGVHMSFTGSTATSNAIYTDRPGRWVAYWSVAGNIGPTSDDQTLYCSAYLNGINQGGTSLAIAYYRNTGINWAFAQYRDLNAGDYIQVSSTNTYWCSGDLTFFVGLYFVPTAGRWH